MPYLEKTPNLRSAYGYCYGCGKRLEPGEFQIVRKQSSWFKTRYNLYHVVCYSKNRCVRRPQCLRYLVGFDMFQEVDSDTKQVLFNMYPGIVPHEDRAFLSLPKSIDKMKIKELKFELTKRDLARNGKKLELATRLKDYVDHSETRIIRSKYLANGYCREMEGKKYNLNIPIYLKQIVSDYFGAGIKPKYSNEKTHSFRIWP